MDAFLNVSVAQGLLEYMVWGPVIVGNFKKLDYNAFNNSFIVSKVKNKEKISCLVLLINFNREERISLFDIKIHYNIKLSIHPSSPYLVISNYEITGTEGLHYFQMRKKTFVLTLLLCRVFCFHRQFFFSK